MSPRTARPTPALPPSKRRHERRGRSAGRLPATPRHHLANHLIRRHHGISKSNPVADTHPRNSIARPFPRFQSGGQSRQARNRARECEDVFSRKTLAHKVERFLSEPVPSGKQLSLRRVPDQQGEHPVQPLGQLSSPLPPPMHQNLRITVIRLKPVPRRQQFLPQLPMVVNAAIENHRNQSFFLVPPPRRHHRLRPAGMVDDRQPPMHQRHIHDGPVRPHRPISKPPLPIRPPVLDRLIQNVEPRFGNRRLRRWHRRPPLPHKRMNSQNSRDPAHTRSKATPRHTANPSPRILSLASGRGTLASTSLPWPNTGQP